MQHLNLETLARIIDETPAPEESAHLESCAHCRGELDALREDVHALGMLPDVAPAPDAWAALERRLVDEGVIRVAGRRAGLPRLAQLAAAIVLFIAGSLAGRMTATADPISTTQTPPTADAAAPASRMADADAPATAADEPVTSGAPQQSAVGADELRQRIEPAPTMPIPAPERSVRFAGGLPQPATIEEAAELLMQTEELYVAALTRYAELSTREQTGDPVARLAAMQSIVMTTQSALMQAPADPVINGYHLTALAQRDATLAQVAAATGERWY